VAGTKSSVKRKNKSHLGKKCLVVGGEGVVVNLYSIRTKLQEDYRNFRQGKELTIISPNKWEKRLEKGVGDT